MKEIKHYVEFFGDENSSNIAPDAAAAAAISQQGYEVLAILNADFGLFVDDYNAAIEQINAAVAELANVISQLDESKDDAAKKAADAAVNNAQAISQMSDDVAAREKNAIKAMQTAADKLGTSADKIKVKMLSESGLNAKQFDALLANNKAGSIAAALGKKMDIEGAAQATYKAAVTDSEQASSEEAKLAKAKAAVAKKAAINSVKIAEYEKKLSALGEKKEGESDDVKAERALLEKIKEDAKTALKADQAKVIATADQLADEVAKQDAKIAEAKAAAASAKAQKAVALDELIKEAKDVLATLEAAKAAAVSEEKQYQQKLKQVKENIKAGKEAMAGVETSFVVPSKPVSKEGVIFASADAYDAICAKMGDGDEDFWGVINKMTYKELVDSGVVSIKGMTIKISGDDVKLLGAGADVTFEGAAKSESIKLGAMSNLYKINSSNKFASVKDIKDAGITHFGGMKFSAVSGSSKAAFKLEKDGAVIECAFLGEKTGITDDQFDALMHFSLNAGVRGLYDLNPVSINGVKAGFKGYAFALEGEKQIYRTQNEKLTLNDLIAAANKIKAGGAPAGWQKMQSFDGINSLDGTLKIQDHDELKKVLNGAVIETDLGTLEKTSKGIMLVLPNVNDGMMALSGLSGETTIAQLKQITTEASLDTLKGIVGSDVFYIGGSDKVSLRKDGKYDYFQEDMHGLKNITLTAAADAVGFKINTMVADEKISSMVEQKIKAINGNEIAAVSPGSGYTYKVGEYTFTVNGRAKLENLLKLGAEATAGDLAAANVTGVAKGTESISDISANDDGQLEFCGLAVKSSLTLAEVMKLKLPANVTKEQGALKADFSKAIDLSEFIGGISDGSAVQIASSAKAATSLESADASFSIKLGNGEWALSLPELSAASASASAAHMASIQLENFDAGDQLKLSFATPMAAGAATTTDATATVGGASQSKTVAFSATQVQDHLAKISVGENMQITDELAKAITAAIDGDNTLGAAGAGYYLQGEEALYIINAGAAASGPSCCNTDAVLVKITGLSDAAVSKVLAGFNFAASEETVQELAEN